MPHFLSQWKTGFGGIIDGFVTGDETDTQHSTVSGMAEAGSLNYRTGFGTWAEVWLCCLWTLASSPALPKH